MLTRSLSVLDVPSEDRVAIEAVLAGHQDMRRRKSIAMSIDSGSCERGGGQTGSTSGCHRTSRLAHDLCPMMLKASDRKRIRQRDRSSRSMQAIVNIKTGEEQI
jgi:hypothetical protein